MMIEDLRDLYFESGSPFARGANLSNAAAYLYERLGNVNWVGFYLVDGDDLILGPFQGPVACTSIAKGRGVCGTAFQRKETIVVPDVDAFPGHIACSSLSRSEIVIPLIRDGYAWGVLDIDSPVLDRFSDADREELEEIASYIALNY